MKSVPPLLLLFSASLAAPQFDNLPTYPGQIQQRQQSGQVFGNNLYGRNGDAPQPTPFVQPGYGGNSGSPHYQNQYVNHSLLAGQNNFQFAMKAYSDPQSRMPDGNRCICPEALCSEPHWCMVTFTFIVTTPGYPTETFSVNNVRLEESGDLPALKISEWGRTNLFNTLGRPASLDILVQHRGATYDEIGKPVGNPQIYEIDRFHVDLLPILPSVGGIQDMYAASDYLGTTMRTKLSLSMSLSCQNGLIGPDCDLVCNRSSINPSVATCRSQITGYFVVCNWASGGGQVENCKRCPWGIKEETYCQDEAGGVLDPATAGVVDTSYKTATILLSILLFVLLVGLAAVVAVLCCKNRRQDKREQPLPGHNVRAAEAAAQRPLLASRHGSSEQAPSPLPRTLPSEGLQQPPMPKSALRKPMLPPPAHLGGSNSVNDTLNSSFSDIPVRPSRSEIV